MTITDPFTGEEHRARAMLLGMNYQRDYGKERYYD